MEDKSNELSRCTANQVVAHNLRLARQQRGWTQEQAAAHLEPYLGVRWSKATYSAAERSSERSDRVRQFTADDLLAFSAAFDVPVHYFLLPPVAQNRTEPVVAANDQESARSFSLAAYLDTVFGSDKGSRRMQRRLKAILKVVPPTPESEKLRETTRGLIEARLVEHKEELETWREALVAMLVLLINVETDLFRMDQGERMKDLLASFERLRRSAPDEQEEDVEG
jgi:transcriptional regulator with XRE-family HTH domain